MIFKLLARISTNKFYYNSIKPTFYKFLIFFENWSYFKSFVFLIFLGSIVVSYSFVADFYEERSVQNRLTRLPGYTLSEVVVLNNSSETGDRIFNPTIKESALVKDSKFKIQNSTSLLARYSSYGQEISIDSSLPKPIIRIENGPYPTIEIDKLFDRAGKEANYYFEFDTDPDFKSPNLWRYPPLLNIDSEPDRPSREGAVFDVMRTVSREWKPGSNEMVFPFRASAMRLPDWSSLSFDEMQKQARALGFGLSPTDTIRDAYHFALHVYPWANDTIELNAIDTFTRGMGECGYVNDLFGTLLEMNGIRYRGVSGFNPLIRKYFPGGGHSTVEVHNPDTGKWGYVDPYLGVFLPDISAKEIALSGSYREIVVYSLGGLAPELGENATLPDIFRYRRYSDKRRRVETAYLAGLGSFKEEDYGLNWKLELAPEYSADELFPREATIFVRARYIFSSQTPTHYTSYSQLPSQSRASDWGTASFRAVTPRDTAAGQNAPLQGSVPD